MNSRILGLRIAGSVFALVSLAQLLRLVMQLEIIAGGHRIPLWPSGIAFVITGFLSVWLWNLSKPGTR
jgi:hypothetical protein